MEYKRLNPTVINDDNLLIIIEDVVLSNEQIVFPIHYIIIGIN